MLKKLGKILSNLMASSQMQERDYAFAMQLLY